MGYCVRDASSGAATPEEAPSVGSTAPEPQGLLLSKIAFGPFHLTNGDLLAVSKADLQDGSIVNLINLRANPTQTTNAATGVWTGTKADGTASTNTCSDWTSDTATGTRGLRTQQNSTWTEDILPSTCDQMFLLYCFQVQ